jgi:hypothetical protein
MQPRLKALRRPAQGMKKKTLRGVSAHGTISRVFCFHARDGVLFRRPNSWGLSEAWRMRWLQHSGHL